MVDVGVMTDNDRDAFQEAGLCSCAFSIRACNAEAHHLAAFWKAFFMLGSMKSPERSPFHGW